MVYSILVVEDEIALQEALAYNLSREGYEVEVAGDGREALNKARTMQPDLIILDLMLPIFDGIEVCRVLRQEMNNPILILTARDSEIDRVLGLEIGADDYLTKPFSMRELQARVKALLRRVRLDRENLETETAKTLKILTFGDLAIDSERHEVRLAGKILPLKPKEYDLLQFFALHKGQVLSRDILLERVWGWDYSGGSRTVDVHVRWLREKIEKKPAQPERIVTVHSAGYRFDG